MSVVSTYQLPAHALCARLSTAPATPDRPPLVAIGCGDRTVRVMRFGDGQLQSLLEGSAAPVTAVAFDREATRIVGGHSDGAVRVWDLKTASSIRTLGSGHKREISCVDYHPFGDFAATAGRDRVLRIWDMRRSTSVQSHKATAEELCNGTMAELTFCRFAPSGKWVASGCAAGIIRLYDLAAGKELVRFEAHSAPITSIAFHPEQFLMTATSEDGTLSLWNLETHTKVFKSKSNFMPAAYTGAQFLRSTLVAANKGTLRAYSFSAMGDSRAVATPTQWDGVSDMLLSGGEALAVECRGASVNFFRVPCGDKDAAAPSAAAAPAAAAGRERKESPPPQQYQPHRVVRDPLPPTPSSAAAPSGQRGGGGGYAGGGSHNASPDDYLPPAPAERLHRVSSGRAAKPITAAVAGGHYASSSSTPPPTPPVTRISDDDDEAMLDGLVASSATMAIVLGRRATHLGVCRRMWPDMRGVLGHLGNVLRDDSDGGAVTDFLNAAQHQRIKERVTIEVLPEALTLIASVVATQKREGPLLAAVQVARSLNNKYRRTIDDALRGAAFQGRGVDFSMESRIAQSRKAQLGFDEIYLGVAQYMKRTDRLGEEVRGLLQELPNPLR